MAARHRSLRKLGGALAATALLGGCATPAYRPAPPASAYPPPQPQAQGPLAPSPQFQAPAQPPQPPPPVRRNRLSPATRSLVMQARALIRRGELDGASATLDRALRIEPSNPLLWIELGRLRLAQNDAHQGEGCARKALSLASGDPSAQARASRLLAEALRAQGRNREALEVERRPKMR